MSLRWSPAGVDPLGEDDAVERERHARHLRLQTLPDRDRQQLVGALRALVPTDD